MIGAARVEESEFWSRDGTKGKRAAVSDNEHLGRLGPLRLVSDAREQPVAEVEVQDGWRQLAHQVGRRDGTASV